MNSELVRFHEMLRSKDVIGIKDFVQKMGVNYTQKGDNWNFLHSCLVPVVFTPDPEIVQLLVDLGIDTNARDSYLEPSQKGGFLWDLRYEWWFNF